MKSKNQGKWQPRLYSSITIDLSFDVIRIFVLAFLIEYFNWINLKNELNIQIYAHFYLKNLDNMKFFKLKNFVKIFFYQNKRQNLTNYFWIYFKWDKRDLKSL